jgi:phage shock protein E
MKHRFHAAWLVLLISGAAYAQDYRYGEFVPQAIIDVRTPAEFGAGHIQGAVNIPYDRIGAGIASLQELKKDGPVLVYCRSGRRSAIAKSELQRLGYRDVRDGGGMTALVDNLKPCTAKTC